jgi:myo-inositol-1-phosphate synthase
MKKIKIAIVGVGNCASALIQGIEFYKRYKKKSTGLIYYEIGGYTPDDIEVVAAFDIDRRKVGKDISQAIFAKPNCTKIFFKNVPKYGVTVKMGKILDGVPLHMQNFPKKDKIFLPANKSPCNIVETLKKTKTDILINYLPVGSEKATRHYAQCCLKAGVAFINAIPVFVASNFKMAQAFKKNNIPLVGDDIKSQLGATILHRSLVKLFEDRGIKIDRTYQLNIGGNTDFLNMLAQERLKSKRISKTEAIQSQLKKKLQDKNIRIGPSDYVEWLKDNKTCFIRLEGRGFGNTPINLELKLSVEDSPNSAGIMIDVIRCCKLALDRKIGGILKEVCAYGMKHPPIQMSDLEAKMELEKFINGKI